MTAIGWQQIPFVARLALFSLLALSVRVFTAGWGGLSCDEAYCANIVEAPSWSQMFEYIKQDGNAPLIYVILRAWGLTFGFGDLSFRIFAVGMSTAIVPLAYALFRQQLGEKLSTQVALLLAFCAPLIHFGVLVRGYGLLPLLSLLATYQLLLNLHKTAGWIEHLKYALMLAAIVYLHHWGGMLATGHAVVAVAGCLFKWWPAERLRRWLAAVLLAVVLYLPWVFVLINQLKVGVSPWIMTPGWQEIVFYAPVEAVAGYRESPDWVRYLNMIWADVAVWAGLLVPVVVAARKPDLPLFNSRFWQIIAAAGIGAAALISQVRPIWRDRYLIVFTPLLLLLQVALGHRLTVSWHPIISSGLPVLAWLIVWIPQLVFFHQYPESSTWVLAEQVGKLVNPSKDLVVVSFQAIAPQVNRYLPANIKSVSFPDMEKVYILRWEGINERVRDNARLARLLETMKETLSKGGDIWLIESVHDHYSFPLDYPIEQTDFNTAEAIRMCQIRTWLKVNAAKDKEDLWAPGRELPVMASHFRPL